MFRGICCVTKNRLRLHILNNKAHELGSLKTATGTRLGHTDQKLLTLLERRTVTLYELEESETGERIVNAALLVVTQQILQIIR